MKDYSFGDKEYQKNFILYSRVIEDYKIIIVYLASGEIRKIPNTVQNQRKIHAKMKEQIQIAYDIVHGSIVDYSSFNIMEYIRRYINMKSRLNDIDKNKIFLDSLDYINRALAYDKYFAMCLPFHLQKHFIFRKSSFTLDDADCFNIREVKKILEVIDIYGKQNTYFWEKVLKHK